MVETIESYFEGLKWAGGSEKNFDLENYLSKNFQKRTLASEATYLARSSPMKSDLLQVENCLLWSGWKNFSRSFRKKRTFNFEKFSNTMFLILLELTTYKTMNSWIKIKNCFFGVWDPDEALYRFSRNVFWQNKLNFLNRILFTKCC